MTGVWSVNGEEGSEAGAIPLQVSISYLQKIEPAPELAYIAPGGEFGITVNTETGATFDFLDSAVEIETRCGTGVVANPSAEPGNLCFFVETESAIAPAEFGVMLTGTLGQSDLWISPDPESGAIIPFSLEEEPIREFEASPGGFAKGSWAVAK